MGQFELLSEFADLNFLPTMGTPSGKDVDAKPALPAAANDVEQVKQQQQVQSETSRDKRAAEVDEAYTQMFEAINTKGIERLLAENNEQINKLTNIIADWYKYTRLQNMLARAQEDSSQFAQNDDSATGDDDGSSQDSQQGDTYFDGPDKNDKDKKKKKPRPERKRKPSRTRRTRGGSRTRTPRPSRAPRPTRSPRPPRGPKGKWAQIGTYLSKMKGTGGKMALLTGLGMFGADAVSDATEAKPAPVKAEVEVERGTPKVKAPGMDPKQEAGLLKRVMNPKLLGKANAALSIGLAANDMYNISQDPNLTDAEKNKAYTRTGFGAAGSVIGGYSGAAIGATIGSIVPVVGTVIGGLLGSAIGSVVGGMGGEVVGDKVYEVVVDMQDAWKETERKREFTVNLESKELAKLNTEAEIARKSGQSKQWASQLSGYVTGQYGGTSGLSNYPIGGYNYQTAAPPRAAVAQIDYREDSQYVPGQGVLKNLPAHDKRDRRLSNFDGIFEQKGQKYNLDPALLRAVAKQESGGDPNITSYAGAGGLMQLMPATGAEMGVTNRFDPNQSVDGGAKYLSKQMKKYGDTKLALAAYNAGPGNIDEAIRKAGTRDPDAVLAMLPNVTSASNAAQTQQYVRNITGFHQEYKALAEQAKATNQDAASSSMPEVVRQQIETDREAPAAPSEVVVKREPTADKILAQTTVAEPVPSPEPKKERNVPTMLARQRAAPAVPQQGSSGGASLDDMPLLLTEMGLGSMLMGEV